MLSTNSIIFRYLSARNSLLGIDIDDFTASEILTIMRLYSRILIA